MDVFVAFRFFLLLDEDGKERKTFLEDSLSRFFLYSFFEFGEKEEEEEEKGESAGVADIEAKRRRTE